jgi:hypothetical protein
MNTKLLSYSASLLGILFLILAIIYWTVPAGSLPHFIPGFETGGTTIHFKHGLAALILSLLSFTWAWFEGGKKHSGHTA